MVQNGTLGLHYSLGRRVVKKVLLRVFFQFPLLTISCLAAYRPKPVEHLWNIKLNLFNNLMLQTVDIGHTLS